MSSDHFDGKQFRNLPGDYEARSFADVLKWKLTTTPARWPKLEPIQPAKPEARVDDLRVTMVGHASLLVQHAGVNVLTDPVWSDRASPFAWAGPKRYVSPGVALADLPPIDAVVVSHDHYDHCDVATLRLLEARHHPVVIAGLNMSGVLREARVQRIVELDWWGSTQVQDLSITFAPAQHWSSRSPWDRNTRLWGSFVFSTTRRTFYFAADSGYAGHFAQLRERVPTIDLAAIPIGAYEPRWFMRPQHMNPEDAVRAHLDLGARRSVGIHWGCFQLTDEAVWAPVEDLAAARARAGLTDAAFQPFRTGETVGCPP